MSTILYLLLLLSFTSSVLSTNDEENVLLKMKNQLGDPDILQSWVKGYDFCPYSSIGNNVFTNIFVSCTSNGRVRGITIQYLNITTPFPDALCDLTELEDLYIYQMPGLYGPIPSCITKLFNLNYLSITYTSLSGSVPSFYNLPNITHINLERNHLSGTVPPSLSTLPNLHKLLLSSNYLFGTIPLSLSTLPNLHSLDLSSNKLTGTIPPGLVHGLDINGYHPSLTLSNNNLTGELPKCYGLGNFFTIDLDNNRLSGDASFLFGKQKITTIRLANNDFEFDLSHAEFSDHLVEVNLSHNKIYGKVPESFATAARLYYANLSFNRLCGELPQGGNMCRFNAADFANNTCLFGYPSPCYIPPESVSVSEPPF